MLLKVIFLYSALNAGDAGQTNELIKQMTTMHQNSQTVCIDTHTKNKEFIAAFNQESGASTQPCIVCAVGEKGLEALVSLEEQKLIDHQKTYISASIHQPFADLKKVSLDFLAIPEATITPAEKADLMDRISHVSLTFATPTNNPSIDTLQAAYDNWMIQDKPARNEDTIIVMLPGDAPETSGAMRFFTKKSAKKLFKYLYAFWKNHGSKHKIIIQNGPRTGKHNPDTGSIACTHEYKKGESSAVAVDPISRYFVNLCTRKKLKPRFFNFTFEVDGTNKVSHSVFNQLLYVGLSTQANNYFIVPGESVSMVGQIPLYLSCEKVIVFRSDAMNPAHEKIVNLAIQRGYVSYFSDKGNIITPTLARKRMDDDGKHLMQDMISGYKKKFPDVVH